MQIFKKYTWLPLLLLNIFLAGMSWLFFMTVIAVGVGENYHPDSLSRSLVPLSLTLFLTTTIFFLGSLLGWIKWRSISRKKIATILLLYFVVLILGGGVAYLLTEVKPEYRTYEHNGSVYKIPREYSPNKYWGDNLSIDVCGNSPLVAEYDRTAISQVVGEKCEQGTHALEPVTQGYSLTSGNIFKRDLVNGKHGFTIATTTNSLILDSVDDEVLEENKVKRTVTGDRVTFKSTIGGLHKRTFYLEFVDNELEWMTVCSGRNCRNYSSDNIPKPYILRTAVYNEAQYERGYLTRKEIAEYKVVSDEVYQLFESFKVN